MAQLRIAIFLAMVLPLLVLPAIASAQISEFPHIFYGSASIDGANAASGTKVSAQIDSKEVTSAIYDGTKYAVAIIAPMGQSSKDRVITFIVGAGKATQVSKYTPGEVTNLNLTATTVPPGPPNITLIPVAGVASMVTGTNFTPNSAVTVTAGGVTLATAPTDKKGSFMAVIVAPDQTRAGKVTILAKDATGKSDAAELTVPDLKGPAGPASPPGRDGAPGPAGQAGKDSAPGKAGADGKSSPPGAAGPTGPAGLPGRDGAPGKEGTDGAPANNNMLRIAMITAIVAIIISVFALVKKPAKTV